MSECVALSRPKRLARSLVTRVLHGGMCGQPCVRCGRPTTYWTRYCEGYVLAALAAAGTPTHHTTEEEA